jgi:hypothetical protein
MVTTPKPRSLAGLRILLCLAAVAAAPAALASDRGPHQARFWLEGVASEKRAEKPYALIFGTVYASDNRPAYGVRVKIRRADQKRAQWELYSDHQGEFAQRVPAGAADYIVWAEPEDKRLPRTEVKVHVEHDERVDLGLHLTN